MAQAAIYSQLAPTVISGLGALFGGGGPKIDWTQYDNATQGQKDIGTDYANLGANAQGNYGGDNSAARQALAQYAAYLGQNHATSQNNAAQLQQSQGGAATAYSKAREQLTADMARRGIGNSGVAAGALANTYSAQAGNAATNQYQLGEYNDQQRRQDYGSLAQLLNGQANQDFSQASGTLGARAGIDSNLTEDAYRRAMGGYNAGVAGQAQEQGAYGNFANAVKGTDWGSIFTPKTGTAAAGPLAGTSTNIGQDDYNWPKPTSAAPSRSTTRYGY